MLKNDKEKSSVKIFDKCCEKYQQAYTVKVIKKQGQGYRTGILSRNKIL